MMRLLEVIVALILVVILAAVIGVLMPSHADVQRSIEVLHNRAQIFDLLNNFRTFPQYSALGVYDPDTRFKLSGPAYGEGATISWHSSNDKVGDGSLEIVSSKPPSHLLWALNNDWRGHNKRFSIDLDYATEKQKLVNIDWRYDVDYGWNLLDRYSQLYLHGDPASLIQYSLNNLQSLLANAPNVDYKGLQPSIVPTPQQPILFVSLTTPRSLDDIASATEKAMTQINDAIKKLGVKAAGPRVTFTTDWGTENYVFDVALPIDSTTLKIGDKQYDLTQAPPPPKNSGLLAPAESAAEMASSAGAASAASGANAGSSPAGASSTASGAKAKPLHPGDYDKNAHLIVNQNVRARMAFGGTALEADWHGSPAGIPLMRLGLKAYAMTHGYVFQEDQHRFYDVVLSDPETTPEDDQDFRIYLPLQGAPAKTPWQIDNPSVTAGVPGASSSAPMSSASGPSASGSSASGAMNAASAPQSASSTEQ